MKKLLLIFIGFVVLLGGMHAIPVHAVSHDDAMTINCSVCSEEGQMYYNCDNGDNRELIDTYITSSGNDCSCYFESHENNHHAGVLQPPVRPVKVKGSVVNRFLFLNEDYAHECHFLSDLNSHAPPYAYIGIIGSVRQLR